MNTQSSVAQLQTLGAALRRLHSAVLEAEKPFHPPVPQVQWLDRLLNDPAWQWLRPLSSLTADIDHVLESGKVTEHDAAVVAGHFRELLAGNGDANSRAFAERYLPLLQTSIDLASLHGELKQLLKAAPVESTDEAERLHRRHVWNERCTHVHGRSPGSG